MPEKAPYISFVVTSRNDDHGGDLRNRMMIFYKGLIHQCNAFKLPCELIVVDWNSPDENELLDTVFPAPEKDDYLSVRIIVVPPSIHKSLRYSEQLGLYQMIAKNVGIRRAKANFINCTNIDLLFSDQLFQELAKRNLEEGKYYRANRCDIPATISADTPTNELLDFASKNIKVRLGRDSRYPVIYNEESRLFQRKIYRPLIWFLNGLKTMMISEKQAALKSIDSDACGDFTMMSKADWEKIEGYVELEMYSLHIDTLALFAAVAKGIKQVTYPLELCTYHIEHGNGWPPPTALDKLKFYSTRPSIDWRVAKDVCDEIVRTNSNYGINTKNWGLNDIALKEIQM